MKHKRPSESKFHIVFDRLLQYESKNKQKGVLSYLLKNQIISMDRNIKLKKIKKHLRNQMIAHIFATI